VRCNIFLLPLIKYKTFFLTGYSFFITYLSGLYRVEPKIFVFAFRENFLKCYFRFRENFITKIDENSGNFRESFRENAKSVIFTTYFTFLRTFCQLFYFKRLTLVNSIQSDVPFPKYSNYQINNVSAFSFNFCKEIFAKIFVFFATNLVFSPKFSRKFRENAKIKFSFGPYGN
jgi:hypothetical protein